MRNLKRLFNRMHVPQDSNLVKITECIVLRSMENLTNFSNYPHKK